MEQTDSAPRARARGFRAERELVAKLWRMGFAVMRGPASGAKVRRGVYPDVIAIKDGKIFVLEVKVRSRPSSIYLEREQMSKLLEFARRASGEAILAIRITSLRTWKAVPVSEANLALDTLSRVKISKSTIDGSEDLFTYLSRKISRSIEEYMDKR
ncbi:MAG: Holliday junction resolvase Hjc [Ignisphaera sp.]|nr:Holliday junction resolvase Hjc [Ignisphaera sp.]MCX8168025.1 Holliday junction resolvase Hjc [Ignisphaera sp.]MDW8085504.1 Holliday junction resolvase Hjc [Ignisphaera sp.]